MRHRDLRPFHYGAVAIHGEHKQCVPPTDSPRAGRFRGRRRTDRYSGPGMTQLSPTLLQEVLDKFTLKSHQISSKSPGQQKSWKFVPKPRKIMTKWTLVLWEIQLLRKLILAKYLKPNGESSNPRHPNSNPRIIRKNSLEIHMKKLIFVAPKIPKKLSKLVPEINKKSTKSKPVLQSVLSCTPQCPRIAPRSPQGAPRRQSRGVKHAKRHGCLQGN